MPSTGSGCNSCSAVRHGGAAADEIAWRVDDSLEFLLLGVIARVMLGFGSDNSVGDGIGGGNHEFGDGVSGAGRLVIGTGAVAAAIFEALAELAAFAVVDAFTVCVVFLDFSAAEHERRPRRGEGEADWRPHRARDDDGPDVSCDRNGKHDRNNGHSPGCLKQAGEPVVRTFRIGKQAEGWCVCVRVEGLIKYASGNKPDCAIPRVEHRQHVLWPL